MSQIGYKYILVTPKEHYICKPTALIMIILCIYLYPTGKVQKWIEKEDILYTLVEVSWEPPCFRMSFTKNTARFWWFKPNQLIRDQTDDKKRMDNTNLSILGMKKSWIFHTAIILIVENTIFCGVIFPMHFQYLIWAFNYCPKYSG